MCGFVGGMLREAVGDREMRAFARAVRELAHRGPDDERLLAIPEASAVLAFRRLSIIDHRGGAQPMSTETGQHLVFNGEIYNHDALRSELRTRGVEFQSQSDTEVLLQTLRRDGASGLVDTAGMFAFAMVDLARRELLLGRDRLGIKQLYYIDAPTGVFFASEPKALLALPWVRATFDATQLGAYFTFRSVPSPATLFRGIARLPAGCTLRFAFDRRGPAPQPRRYWSFPEAVTSAEQVRVADAVDALEDALLTSVRRRLVADVPVGAFLSGGLDSSLVVAAMRRLGHDDLQTFTAAFPGSADDEASYAQRVSVAFATRHQATAVSAADCLSALPRWIELNDDLVADASSIPLLLVSDAARRAGCLVVLAGEGADELFGGYGAQHKFLLLHRLAAVLPSAVARGWLVERALGAGLLDARDAPRVREYFTRRGAYMGAGALAGHHDLARLLEPEAFGAAAEPRAKGDDLESLCRFEFTTRIPDDLLVRTDRATMGASIEARVPFLDHDLVALVNRLPRPARMLPGISKVAPRLLARRWGVPLRTIVHRKIGFQLPLAEWFRGPLQGLLDVALRERAVPGLRYPEIARLVAEHVSGHASHEELLWRVAALECWHRRWIRGERVEPTARRQASPRRVSGRVGALAP